MTKKEILLKQRNAENAPLTDYIGTDGYVWKMIENAMEEYHQDKLKLLDTANVSARTFTPIKVRVKLRQGQYTGVMNKWICTIHGEMREVTMRDVEWYCMNVEDAVHSFKESEIESFSIIGQYTVEPCVR